MLGWRMGLGKGGGWGPALGSPAHPALMASWRAGDRPATSGTSTRAAGAKGPVCHCPQVVLFLFQLEMDSQLQRALTYERFDIAQVPRKGRRGVPRRSPTQRATLMGRAWLAVQGVVHPGGPMLCPLA